MNINYILAAVILIVWLALVAGLQWNEKYSPAVNVMYSVIIFLMLGVFYWAPFWLIFVK